MCMQYVCVPCMYSLTYKGLWRLVCVCGALFVCVDEFVPGAKSEPNRKLSVSTLGAVCSKYNVGVEEESY